MACLSGPMLGIGLTGCTVGPDYQSPEIKEAPRRSALDGESVPSRTVEGAVDIAWWKSFRDFQLSSLVERLVAQNLDLETAAERVVQSVAQRQVAASQGLPHIEGQSSSTYNRQSPNGTLSLLTPAPGAPLEYALFRDGLTSSWQLDLFGRVRRAVEAADADHPGGRGEPARRRARGGRRTGAKLHAIARNAEPSWDRETQSPPRRRERGAGEQRVSATESPPRSTWRKPGLNRPPSPQPCRRCVPRRRSSSTPSDCCWAMLRARSRPSCTAPR